MSDDQPIYAGVATTELSSRDLQFRTSRDDLAEAVGWAAKNLPSRPTVPVLSGLLLNATDEGLTVSAFDYEVSGRAQLKAEVLKPGGVLVSGRLLASIAQSLPNKPVDFTCDGTRVSLNCGKAKFTLPTMEVDTYPALPIIPEETGAVDAETFIEAINQVVIAAGKDDTTPMLTGVRMEIAGKKVKMIATDRFRMAVREFEWEPIADDINAEMLIPAKTLAEVGRSGTDGAKIKLSLGPQSDVGEGLFGFSGDTKRSTTRLLNVEFPEYARLLPSEYTAVASIDVNELTEAVKRVGLMADRNAQVRLEFSEGSLQLAAGGDEIGDAQEDMEIDFAGEPLTIAFNPGYLTDGLAALHSKRVKFGFVAAKRPAVLQAAADDTMSANDDGKFAAVHTDFTYVLMPVRLT